MKQVSKNRSRGRLVLPLFLAGVAVAGIGFALRDRPPAPVAASQVRSDIAALVNDAGFLGPFMMRAASFDTIRHEFADFHAETDELMVAAARARLVVDADDDVISFELFDVTIVRVPDADTDLPVVSRDRYTLGPIPYRADIVDDDPIDPNVRSNVLPE